MAITADVRKFGDTLVAQGKVTLTESTKPLYAVAGYGDLAVEKLRELPEIAQSQIKTAQDQLKTVQADLAARRTKLQGRVTALPQDYKKLPTQVKTYVEDVTGKATAFYGELAERGEKVVAQIRRRPAVKKAAAANKSAKSSAKATKTTATKAVKADAEAVKDAASQVG
jgi:polyhydroxyalkanoate synthesis regulator phasin